VIGYKRRATRGLAGLLLLAVVVTGCTGVPVSSRPQVIERIGGEQTSAPSPPGPQAGAEPRAIVSGFLSNNAAADAHHNAARAYLTSEANNRWSDASVTVVDDPRISNPDAQNRITVTGALIGTIDASGIYTGSQVIGGGGQIKTATFALRKVEGEWRIDGLQNGLIISYSQFQAYYTQRTVYFYDQAEQRLVPDPRFSALQDADQLSTWLMTQMVGGARPELQDATKTELPAQADPRRVTVTVGQVFKVEIPGTSQLADATRSRLAAQVALTLEPALFGGRLSITDGGHAVVIPIVGGTEFQASDFSDLLTPPVVSPALYYLDPNGSIVDATGDPLPGPLGSGAYRFAAFALAQAGGVRGGTGMYAAGTVGAEGAQQLYVGRADAMLHPVAGVSGQLSRPAWAPFLDEVWIGAGTSLYRAGLTGKAQMIPINAGGDKALGTIQAVRLSPEGSRVALVMRNADGVGQIWLGAVIRSGDAIQVSDLRLLSPSGVSITDVAWNDSLKLFAVGHRLNGAANVYELQSDGSLWTARGTPDLPGAPESITVAEHVVAAVSQAESVWVQRGGSWGSPSSGTAHGTNPAYVE